VTTAGAEFRQFNEPASRIARALPTITGCGKHESGSLVFTVYLTAPQNKLECRNNQYEG
jgi:hypothetical protein